jgi:hypothetical protein
MAKAIPRAEARARSAELRASLYDEVAERIIAELEAGRFPCATASRVSAGVTIFLIADPSAPHCPAWRPPEASSAHRSRLQVPAAALILAI